MKLSNSNLEGLLWLGEGNAPVKRNLDPGIVISQHCGKLGTKFLKVNRKSELEEFFAAYFVRQWIGVADGIVFLTSTPDYTKSQSGEKYQTELIHAQLDGTRKVLHSEWTKDGLLADNAVLSASGKQVVLQKRATPRLGNLLARCQARFYLQFVDELLLFTPGEVAKAIYTGLNFTHVSTNDKIIVHPKFTHVRPKFPWQASYKDEHYFIGLDGNKTKVSSDGRIDYQVKYSHKPFMDGLLYECDNQLYYCNPSQNWDRKKLLSDIRIIGQKWDVGSKQIVLGPYTSPLDDPRIKEFVFIDYEGNQEKIKVETEKMQDWRAC